MFENMLANMLKALGITPEKVQATIQGITDDVADMKQRMIRIEAKLDFATKSTPVLALEENDEHGTGDDSGTSH